MFERPLDDIKVVELGSAVSSPLCCLLLAEMGADVIKVEEPGTGDDSRNWGKKVNGESFYFAHYNRGKKSCVVNLKSQKGKEILFKLVERSDVVIENLRPGALDKLGLGYDQLKGVNPRLIFSEISGFGDVRPLRDVAAYDVVVQAMSGLMSITGEPDGEPLRIGLPMVDVLTALFCAYSVSLALRWRDKTGQGQKVGISLLGSALEAVGQWITIYGGTKEVPTRSGNKYPLIAPYEPFKTRDGYIILAVGTERQWESLCRVIGSPELASDPRFASNQDRIEPGNRQPLIERLSEAFAQKSTSEWTALLREEKIPGGPVNSIDKVANDQALYDAQMIVDLNHPALGTVPAAGVVPRFEKSPGKSLGPSPLLGQHTEEILRTLGYTPNEIEELERTGVAAASKR